MTAQRALALETLSSHQHACQVMLVVAWAAPTKHTKHLSLATQCNNLTTQLLKRLKATELLQDARLALTVRP